MDNKVLLIHNIASPYRLPIFEDLSKQVNLTVMFLERKMKGRYWNDDTRHYTFKHVYCAQAVRILRLSIHISTVVEIIRGKYSSVIIVDDLPTAIDTYMVAIVSKLVGCKLVLWNGRFHGGTFGTLTGRSFRSFVEKVLISLHTRIIYQLCDAVISYGSRATRYLIFSGVDPNKIVTGTQVYPKKLIPPLSMNTSMVTRDIKTILTISYLNERKGIDVLIEAFALVQNIMKDVQLFIIGDGPLKGTLETIALDYPDVHFLGNLEGGAKYQYLYGCDVFVLPTLYDSWGLVINEAMELSKPIITTNMAMASTDLIDGNGYVVTAGDAIELKDALINVLSHDPTQMGIRSKQIISGYTVSMVVKNFIRVLEPAGQAHSW